MFQFVTTETGGLFNLAVDLMQLFSENTTYVGCMDHILHLPSLEPRPPSKEERGGCGFLSPSTFHPYTSFLPPSSLLPLSSHFSDFSPLLDTLGLFFQIRDDYANLKSKEV